MYPKPSCALLILLSPLPNCWEYRCAPSCLVYMMLEIEHRLLCIQTRTHPRWDAYHQSCLFWDMIPLWGPGLASHSLCIPGWLVAMILLPWPPRYCLQVWTITPVVEHHTCGQGDSFQCLQEVCDFDGSYLPLNVWRLRVLQAKPLLSHSWS